MDDNFKEEEQHIYEPKSTKTNKIVTRCKSLLNLDLNQLQQQPEQEQGIYKKIGKATSEVNLIHDEKYESARQTDDTTVDDQTKEVVVNGNEIVEDKETTKKTINIAIVNNKKYPKIQLEDKFEKRMNDLLARKKHASESASAINEALANDVIVVEPTRTRRSADNNKFDSRPISSSHLNCRVTGELWKNKTVSGSFEQRYGDLCTLPRTAKSHRSQLQRHFYYHTGRPKSALKDEELPDPDKVKYARDLFENVLKFKPYSAESPPHVVACTTGTTKYNTISSWKPKYQTNHNIMAEELQQPRRHVVDRSFSLPVIGRFLVYIPKPFFFFLYRWRMYTHTHTSISSFLCGGRIKTKKKKEKSKFLLEFYQHCVFCFLKGVKSFIIFVAGYTYVLGVMISVQ